MKSAVLAVLAVLGAAAIGAAAQGPVPVLPASSPASAASAPTPPASDPTKSFRSPAVRAAEKSKEPGQLVPEQRVIPQINLPLKNRKLPETATTVAPGAAPVNDDAARCVAAATPEDKAACQRRHR